MALQISSSDAHLDEPRSFLRESSIVSDHCHLEGMASCNQVPRVLDEANVEVEPAVVAVASTATNSTFKVIVKANPVEMDKGKGAVSFEESPLGFSLKSVISGSLDGKAPEPSLVEAPGLPAVASSSASNTVHNAQSGATYLDVGKTSTTPSSLSRREGNQGIPCDKSGPAYPTGPASSRSWGIPAYEKLLGGGENGANGGNWGPTSGVGGGGAWGPNQWGAAAANAGNRSAPPSQGQQQAQVAQSMPQGGTGGGWKNPAENSSVSTSSSGSPNGNNNNNPAITPGSAKDPNLREVIYSVDGWCSNNVNQDTQWDVPQSPGLPEKDVPLWKQTATNGTEVWEANLRNGGQVPVQPPQPKAPWGHTPSTNIGGTWGEEDDSVESSNTWGHLGASAAPAPGPVGPNAAPMWTGAPKKEPEWTGGQAAQAAGGWGGVPRMTEPEVAPMGPPNHWGNPVKAPTGQWGAAVGPKDVPSWGDQSPPAQKRILSKQDDGGTATWGNPAQQQGKSHWQEMPVTNIGGRAMQPPGPPPGRGPHGPGLKDLPMWGPPRNGSWGSDAAVGDTGSSIWMDGKGWNEPQTPTWGGGPGPKPRTPTTPGGWAGEPEMLDPSSWGQPPKQTSKNLSKETIWASKQFRILSEMGFKKDDVENALRASGMVMEDALETLHAGRMAMGGWRPPGEDHSSVFDPVGPPGGHFPPGGQRFGAGGGHQQMAFGHPGAASMGIGGFGGAGSGLLQKTLPQQPPPIPQQMFGIRGGGSRDLGMSGGQPSPAQLRGLVQQIQMAVHAGHLNPQILNQPLAPQTLLLLNQLLQQLKILQQLSNQQAALGVRPSMGAGGPAVQLMQQIAKTKQQIGNLQSQISTQQAIYIKQQQQGQYVSSQQPPGAPPAQAGLDLHSKFDQMSLQDGQSRLTQWKRTSPMDKSDLEMEFSRAPGANSGGSKPALSSSLSSPNLNPLLGHGEGAWSSLSRSQSDSGWPEAGNSDLTTPTTVEVPEFKPGEPWKGPLAKNIEDDPTLTPAQFMGSDSFPAGGGKSSSPPASGVAGGGSSASDALSSSTWSFNSASAAGGGQSGNKFGQSDLWGAQKPRGPPPGISAASKYGSAGGNWSGALSGNSPYLVLRNLTPQIDGSTLKTLCAQHGPVQSFHLYLNQGVAFVRYSSSDEAAKAQGALNNCVLGNTTILADLANESEVQGWLQQLGMPPAQQQQQQPQQQPSAPGAGNWSVRGSTPSSGSGSTKTGSTSGPVDSWTSPGPSTSPMWSTGSGSVWSSTSLERGNGAGSSLNATLNSYLPGDLLGNESM